MSREAHVRICERLGYVRPRSTRLRIGIPPQLSVSKAVQFLKGKSWHRLLTEYGALRTRYWGQHQWARGYWLASSDNVTDGVWEIHQEPDAAGARR